MPTSFLNLPVEVRLAVYIEIFKPITTVRVHNPRSCQKSLCYRLPSGGSIYSSLRQSCKTVHAEVADAFFRQPRFFHKGNCMPWLIEDIEIKRAKDTGVISVEWYMHLEWLAGKEELAYWLQDTSIKPLDLPQTFFVGDIGSPDPRMTTTWDKLREFLSWFPRGHIRELWFWLDDDDYWDHAKGNGISIHINYAKGGAVTVCGVDETCIASIKHDIKERGICG